MTARPVRPAARRKSQKDDFGPPAVARQCRAQVRIAGGLAHLASPQAQQSRHALAHQGIVLDEQNTPPHEAGRIVGRR